MKRILLITTTLTILLLLCSQAWAGVAHYADLGDAGSTNQGTFAEPFNTIALINAHAMATGDDIYFAADMDENVDTYLDIDWDGTSGDRIIIGAYDGDGDFDITGSARPILDGNQTIPSTSGYDGLIDKQDGTGYVTVQDIRIDYSGYYGMIFKDQTNINVGNCYVYRARKAGIMYMSVDTGTIEENIIEEASYLQSPVAGIVMSGGNYAGNTTNITCRKNKVFHCYEGIGLYKSAGPDNIVEYNNVYDNRSYQIYVTTGASNNIVRYNLVYQSTDAVALWGGRDSGIVLNCEAATCLNQNPQICGTDNEIYGNLIAACGNGITVKSLCTDSGLYQEDHLIYNNTIIDCVQNFRFNFLSVGAGIEIKNNISWAITDAHMNDDSPAGVTWSHNYYNTDPGGNANDNAVIDAGGPLTSTTSGWRTLASDGSVDGTEFEITSASPCKDTGVALGSAYVNGLFTGTDFSTSPPTVVTASQLEHGTTDIGAWIYDTGAPPVGGECLLDIEAAGTTGFSVGKGDWDFGGTENTSGGTIAICKVAYYAKRIGTPTTIYVDIYARDGGTPANLTGAATAVVNTASTVFPTGSPSWVELEVSPTVDWDDGEVLVIGTRNVDDVVNYLGLYYGTDTVSGDIGVPERWASTGVRQDAWAANDIAIKIYGYSAAAGNIEVDGIGIATVLNGIVTYHDAPTPGVAPATLDALEGSTGFPGWYWAVKLSEQPTVIAQPESSEFKWDCGPLSTDYDESPYYACLPDSSNNYYLLYTPNLLAGHRAVHPQAYGTTAADYIVMNDAVIQDGDANDVDLTYATVDIDAGGTITIGVADTFYIAASGADETIFTDLITAIDHLVPGDNIYFNRGETFTEKMTVATSGTSGSHITFGAYGTGADPIIDGNGEVGALRVNGRSYLDFSDIVFYRGSSTAAYLQTYDGRDLSNITFTDGDGDGVGCKFNSAGGKGLYFFGRSDDTTATVDAIRVTDCSAVLNNDQGFVVSSFWDANDVIFLRCSADQNNQGENTMQGVGAITGFTNYDAGWTQVGATDIWWIADVIGTVNRAYHAQDKVNLTEEAGDCTTDTDTDEFCFNAGNLYVNIGQDPGDGENIRARYGMVSDITFTKCVVSNTVDSAGGSDGSGFMLDTVTDSKIERCYSHDNDGYGIVLGGSIGCEASYNLVVDNNQGHVPGQGIRVNRGSYNSKIYNNTMYTPGAYGVATLHTTDLTAIKNNIISGATTHAIADVDNDCTNDTEDYNAYYNCTANVANVTSGGHSITTNPLLRDPANDDFYLTAGSPGIDTGENLGASHDDGITRGSVWPDSVNTGDQDNYGAGWEMGAFIYFGGCRGMSRMGMALK